MLDGVFTAADALAAPIFHPATRVTDADVAKLLSTIRSRVLRLCRRLGLMGEGGELGASAPGETQGLLPFLCAASIQGRSALGSLRGARIEQYCTSPSAVPGRATIIKELCADLDARLVLGTPSLHAAVKIEAGRTSRLEHLCRYIGRPPFSNERPSLSQDGKVVLELAQRHRAVTTARTSPAGAGVRGVLRERGRGRARPPRRRRCARPQADSVLQELGRTSGPE